MKNCALFCGGHSSEFEISMKSANNILKSFPKEFSVFKVVVSGVNWKIEIENSFFDFDFNCPGFQCNSKRINFDFAMIYIHGNPGENGKIQAYLDIFQIPYLNCNALSSAVSFDKWYCNNYLKSFDIPIAENMLVSSFEDLDTTQIINKLKLPLFVKPTDSGSSYGISRVSQKDQLLPAIKFGLNEGKMVILESLLIGKEITCAVYQNQSGIQTLPLTEIVTENEFFDFDAKYNGKSEEITPARISNDDSKIICELAKKIYSLLHLKSFVRIDFMLEDNKPFLIEVNTIPGFSNESIVPKMLQVAQINPTDFLRELIRFELKLG